ncbi:MAG: DUF177 domain-containing protein [Rhodothermales bacterium]|nr:DUF177 domain-containing protein [Rhodothermales bacterium]
MVRIDLKPLKSGPHEFDREPEPESLGLDPAVFSDIRLHVRLDVQPENVFVRLTASGVATLICDRTLVPYDEPVAGDFAMLYVLGSGTEPRDESLDDVIELAPEEEEIDLTEAVRDTLLLALPHRRVAPGADALELPLQYGAPADDEVVDPRWDALRNLRTDDGAL